MCWVLSLQEHLKNRTEFYTVYLLRFIPFQPLGPLQAISTYSQSILYQNSFLVLVLGCPGQTLSSLFSNIWNLLITVVRGEPCL